MVFSLPGTKVQRNKKASYLRSKGRGFEARPWRCCATTLGKLFTPHCLIHVILHEEDCELLIKSKIKNDRMIVSRWRNVTVCCCVWCVISRARTGPAVFRLHL